MKKKIPVIAACSLLAITAALAVLYFAGTIFRKAPPVNDQPVIQNNVQDTGIKLSDIRITPLVSDGSGVDTASSFRLSYSGKLGQSFLETSLKVKPEQEFKLKKDKDSSYLINFTNPLKSNSIYKFEIQNDNSGDFRSWAFQTMQAFSITRTLPRNQAIQVPVDTGIEITFSNENIENLDDYFEISPAVKGRFELHMKTVVFVPEKLDYGTVYTVTVKKGLGFKDSSEKLADDYTFSFQTAVKEENNGSNYFSFADTSYNFTPDTTPALKVYASDEMFNYQAQVQIFQYPDDKTYTADMKKYDNLPYWAMANTYKSNYDTTGLEKVSSFETKLVKHESSYWFDNYLVLPDKLPQGYYLAKVTINSKTYYIQLQVNNLSVYIMVANNQALVWVNDSTTGKPVEGALVSGEETGSSLKTSSEGLAAVEKDFLKDSENRNYYFNVSDSKNPVFVARVSSINYSYYYMYNNNSSQINNYWSYMYLDRGMYLPNDKVNIWGMLKPRDSGTKPGQLTLELVSNNYYWDNVNEPVIASKDIELSKQGTYSASFELSGFTPGSYIINIKSDGQKISSSYFQVLEYSKPAYKIDLTPSKKAIYSWEKANMDIQASFFEGSPLSGLEVSYNYVLTYPGKESNQGRITCDSNGSATVALDPSTSVNTWRPQMLSFYANSANAEEEEIRANSSITVFPRDTMLEAASTIDGNTCNVNITANRIDLSKLDTKNSNYYSQDQYRGNPVDTGVEVKLYEKYWVARETGEYYDFINKKKVKRYEYNEEQKLIKSYNLNTVNGKTSLSFTTEKEKTYYIEAYYKDSAGRETVETQYIYNWQFNPYNSETYCISPVNNKFSFKKGEDVDLQVMKGSSVAQPSENGRFLYVKMKNGIISSDISSQGKYSFTYSAEDVPNVFVKSVYYDGVYIHDAGLMSLSYDYSEEKLDLSIKPETDSYKPGEMVTLDITAKDQKGNPCEAEVNVSAVDEAFFYLMDQNVDTLSSIYSANMSSGLITDYYSNKSPDERGGGGAEGGEGGDSFSIRKDFRDNAFFGTVTTDSSGHAKISFKLPDNLTTWRITCQGITDDLKAGSQRIAITSKLPFFVDTVFNNVFMDGDSPSILVRANGTELKASDDVKFTIDVSNDADISKSFTVNAKGHSFATVPLGKFEEGTYTVHVKGTSGKLGDGLQRSFKVVPEILQAARLDYSTLSENVKLPGSVNSLTTLSFLNKESSALYSQLLSLYWTWGSRLDQKVSRLVAGDLLNKYYGNEYSTEEAEDISSYQTNDGGLALLTYDSSDPELSAKVCAFIKDKIDSNSLSSYFYNILNNKKSTAANVSYSLWGLASLDKPVLNDIHYLLSSAPTLGLEDRLVLGIALATIGDYDGAEKIYSEVTSKYSVTEGNMTYIKTDGTRDETTELTALCSIMALKLDMPEKQSLFDYASANSTSELLINLEKLIYTASYIPDVRQECSFSYELDGRKQSVDIKGNQKYELILTPQKLSAIKFSDISGNITVAASHTGPVKDMLQTSNTLVGIKRSYQAVGKTATAFDRSDFIKIVLEPSFTEQSPDGYYEITDVLPSGLKYVTRYDYTVDKIFLDEVSGQKVSFGFWYDKNHSKINQIIYYARAVSPGTFTADSAFIKYSKNNICNFSPRLEITIK